MNGVRIRGIEDVRQVLLEAGPREGRNLIRNTTADIAKQAAALGRQESPDDTGKLDSVTKHKRERGSKERAHATVRVGREAFYWFFLEYGHGPDRVEHAMFLKALQRIKTDLPQILIDTFVSKYEAALARKAKRNR